MHEHSEHEARNESFTAMVCEQAQLFGATSGPDEFDNRPVWDEAEATAAVLKAFGASEYTPEAPGNMRPYPIRFQGSFIS